VFLYPASEGRVLETWDPLGMRGTGSHDVVADGVFVPEHRSGVMRPVAEPPAPFDGPFFRFGVVTVALGNASVALGVARAAIDEAVELARSKVPAFQQARPVDRGVVHAHLARAEAGLGAARAYFFGAIAAAWETASEGRPLTTNERMHLQLAASHATEAAAAAVDHVHAAVGSSGVREDQYRFSRHLRDVHTITQHALCSATRFESMGQVMLGLETDWALFYL
jgi:alkylation response protein AidB-like acyl-CoA dehydrogenase